VPVLLKPRKLSTLRGFTLAEISATLVVVGLISLLAAVSLRGTQDAGRDTQAKNALVSFSGAQALRFDTLGSFAATTSEAVSIISTYSFVDGASPSTTDKEISITTGSSDSEDFFAAAVLAASGRCYTVKIFEASSSVQDIRRVFDKDTVVCNGATASSNFGGQSW
jgi:prepilin-type N-terminal cleavage/methylation domain-containing protein